jgi:ribonuclease T1
MKRIYSSLLAIAAIAVLALPLHSAAKQSPGFVVDTIAQSALPKEGQKTLQLIQQGGPFPYADKDASTFGNREGTLPKQKRGYYSEYTVKTPYARNRGAKRIIAGKGSTGNPATSGEYFYTDDHYASFKRIELNK